MVKKKQKKPKANSKGNKSADLGLSNKESIFTFNARKVTSIKKLKKGTYFEVIYNKFVNKNVLNCSLQGVSCDIQIQDLLTIPTLEWLGAQYRNTPAGSLKNEIEKAYNYVKTEGKWDKKWQEHKDGILATDYVAEAQKKNKSMEEAKHVLYKVKIEEKACLPIAISYAFDEKMTSKFILKWNVGLQLQLEKLYAEYFSEQREGCLTAPNIDCVLCYEIGTIKHSTGFKKGIPNPEDLVYLEHAGKYKKYLLVTNSLKSLLDN